MRHPTDRPRGVLDRWPALLSWFFVAGAMFVYCWQDEVLDDLSGWIPAIVALQLLAFPAVGQATSLPPLPAAPLTRGRAIAFTLSLALVSFYVAMILFFAVGCWIWPETDLEFRPLLLGLGLGVATFLGVLTQGYRRHRGQAHPDAVQRSLRELFGATLLLLLVAGATVLRFDGLSSAEHHGTVVELGFLLALPLLWLAPMGLLVPRRSSVPRAVVR